MVLTVGLIFIVIENTENKLNQSIESPYFVAMKLIFSVKLWFSFFVDMDRSVFMVIGNHLEQNSNI